MDGITFYEEFKDTEKASSIGTVVAALVANGTSVNRCGKTSYDAICSVYAHPNSPVASSTVSLDYLDVFCKPISEAQAREIHPRLFEWLDQED